MTYSVVVCDDIAELKTQHPGPTVPVAATIFGANYPSDEDYRVYVWDDWSYATPDDDEVVKPTQDPTDNGRWLKVDLDSSVAPQVNSDWNSVSGVSRILNKPSLATVATSGLYTDLSGKPPLVAVATSGNYNDLTNKPSIPAPQVNSDWNATSGLAQILNKPTVPDTPSQSAPSRSLNSAFQIHATRNALVSYSVQLTVTASISGGQNGDIILEIASNSGFTNNVQTVAITGLGQTYSLAVALQGVQPQTAVVSGFVPAGYYVRLRTVNNTGTPSYSLRAVQEVLI